MSLVAPAAAAPGGLVELGVSGPGGAVRYAFDLNGNGSFETHCGASGKAAAVYTKPGAYRVGVRATYAAGGTSTARKTVRIKGPVAKPPGRSAPLPAGVFLVGRCTSGGGGNSAPSVGTAIRTLFCPSTVWVGVVEATYPANDKGWCFKRVVTGGGKTGRGLTRYVAVAPVPPLVNGVKLWAWGNPSGSHIVISATEQRIYVGDSAGMMLAGGKARVQIQTTIQINLDSKVFPIDWDISKPSVVQQLPLDGMAKFLSLPVTSKETALSFTAAEEATMPLGLGLPWPLDSVGVDGSITLRTNNTDGPVLEAFQVDVSGLLGEVLGVKGHLAYQRKGSMNLGENLWNGAWSVTIPPITVSGQLGFSNGALKQATLTFEHEPGLGPIWCCAYLTKIKGTVKSESISAGVKLSAGPSYGGVSAASIDGDATIYWSPFMLSANGNLKIMGITMGNASATVLPSTFAFQGGIEPSYSIFNVKAQITGSLNTNGSWFAIGAGNVCVDFGGVIDETCAGGAVGVGNEGVAGCMSLTIVEGGAYYHWGGDVGLFWGCSFGDLKGAVTTASLLEPTAQALTVPVAAGQTAVLFKIAGAGGAPHVHVAGPGGVAFDSPDAKGEPFTDRTRWLAIPAPRENATYVAVKRPAPGTWKITALPGSVALTSVRHADGLPGRIATGKLAGRSRQRVLSYTVAPAAGATVTFVERGRRVEHVLGRAAGRSGSLRFTIADGPAGPRRVVALVRSGGFPVREETIARFRAPGPLVLPAPRVAVARRGGALRVNWLPVTGASRYAVEVALADGRRSATLVGRRRTSIRVPRVNALASGAVRVVALSSALRQGRVGKATLAALPPVAAQATSRRELLRGGAIVFRCVPRADGACVARVRLGGRTVASGSRRTRYGSTAAIRARLTPAGRAILQRQPGAALRAEIAVPGAGTRVVRLGLR